MLTSCNKNYCEGGVKAVFQDETGLDGCGMLIKLKNGKFLEPKNLADFDVNPPNGQKIWVSYHLAESGVSTCMVGDLVVVDCLTNR